MGVTLDLRTEKGKELLRRLIEVSDVVTENFAAGVFADMGFSDDELRRIKPDVIYVANSGFGATGPYSPFKTWGPVVQAACGLTFQAGLPVLPAAGYGFSYMDHHGANFMAIAMLAALIHRARTGEGQSIDMSCTEAGATLLGPAWLDYTVNGRPFRRPGMHDSNHSQSPVSVPHNIYHEDIGRDVDYPGAPFRLSASPWRLARRPPRIGEHTDEVVADLWPSDPV